MCEQESPPAPSALMRRRPPMLTLAKSTSIPFRSVASTVHPARPPQIDEQSSSGPMWAAVARRGRRRAQREDTYAAHPFAHETPHHHPLSVFAVFDGHGGPAVARRAARRLPALFLQAYATVPDVARALEHAFLTADAEIIAAAAEAVDPATVPRPRHRTRTRPAGSEFATVALSHPVPCFARLIPIAASGPGARAPLARARSRASDSLGAAVCTGRSCGTTATVVVLEGRTVHVGHVGDSAAVLVGRHGGRRLFEDHRPDRADEMERIERAGGLVVKASGTWRVNGVLGVSRAIGDVGLKEVVIARPEVVSLEIGKVEEGLVVASDGLWDFVNVDECAELVREQLGEEAGAAQAARNLVRLACKKGSTDDVSVVVVNLTEYEELCQEWGLGEEAVVEDVLEDIVPIRGVSATCDTRPDDGLTTPILPLQTPRAGRRGIW